jgi:branched-chain amino acid transport system permease protein
VIGAYEITLVAVVSINLMLALGLNLITGFCGQVSLGHAAFFGTGAYVAALLAAAGMPLAAVLLFAGFAASLLGLLVGFTSLRVREDFLAITTMGVGFVFIGFVRKQSWLGAEMGLTDIPDHGLGDLGFVGFCVLLAIVMAVLTAHIKRSWLGFGFSAVAEDEATARTLGIDSARYKLVAFVIGTFLAGMAGAVYVYFTRFIIPSAFGFTVSISILSMVIVGGVGSIWGVVVASIVLTLLPEFSRVINDYKLLLYGALIVLTMRFAPDGLAGTASRLRAFRKRAGQR